MRDRGQRGMGSKHFESRDNVGPWRSEADEFSSYHTDFDLQVALELDDSQGLYDDQGCEPAQHDMYAQVEYDRRAYNYQTPLPAAARATSATTPQRLATNAAPARATSAATRATTPQRLATNAAPRRSLNTAQLSAAQSALSGIRNTASAHRSAQLPRVAPGHPSLRPAAAQTAQRHRAGLPALQPAAAQPAQLTRSTGAHPSLQPAAAQPAQRSRAGQPSLQPVAAQAAQLPRFAAAHPSLQRQTPAPKLTVQPRAAKPMRMLVDDEPLEYPRARRRHWLGKLAIVLLLAGGGFAAYSYLGMQAAQKAVPVVPPPAATVSAPAPEPATAPAVAPEPVPAAPTPPLTAQERRAAARAARAAMYAERRREREEARAARLEARRARADARASEPEAPKHAKPEPDAAPAPSTSKSWKSDDADKDFAPAAENPSRADDDLLAPADESDEVTAEPAQPKRPAMADTGVLRINSRPWSVVFVDGHPVGHTPQMNLMLPAGEHEITLVNDEMQLRKTLAIDITPGTTTTRTLNLAE